MKNDIITYIKDNIEVADSSVDQCVILNIERVPRKKFISPEEVSKTKLDYFFKLRFPSVLGPTAGVHFPASLYVRCNYVSNLSAIKYGWKHCMPPPDLIKAFHTIPQVLSLSLSIR